jgi:hypothetical protein
MKKQIFKVIGAVITAAVLSGCMHTGTAPAPVETSTRGSGEPVGFLVGPAPAAVEGDAVRSAPAREVTGSTCSRPRQQGCLGLTVLFVRHDPNNQLLARVATPAQDQTERIYRQNKFGPAVWQAYLNDQVQSADQRTILVMVWKPGQGVPFGTAIMGCEGTGRATCQHHTTVPNQVTDVTGQLRQLRFDPSSPVQGQPDVVYQITSQGDDPIGVSLELPHSFFGPQTYVSVCPVQGAVHPGPEMALILGPQTSEYHVRQGSPAIMGAIIFKE